MMDKEAKALMDGWVKVTSKVYLGDSVYVSIENGMVKLTTENGGPPSNEIYLVRPVMDGLVDYCEKVKRYADLVEP